MAQNPVGTATDEERLVPLLVREDSFLVDVAGAVEDADVPAVGEFAWRLREEGDVNRLALAPVDEIDDAGALEVRQLSAGGTRTIEVPAALITEGLGIDTASYDDDNPLLFKPDEITGGVAVERHPDGEPAGTVETALELIPVRYADGSPYRNEALPEASLDSDPVAEGLLKTEDDATEDDTTGDDATESQPAEGTTTSPEAASTPEATPAPEAISAPIDADVLEEVVDESDVTRDAVVKALETIARRDLVEEGDAAPAASPTVVDDRVVVPLAAETWDDRVAEALAEVEPVDVDDAAIDAARHAHARQAATLLAGSESIRETREAFQNRTPVVVQPGRQYDTEAPQE